MAFGVEKVSDTWGKLSLSTDLVIPLSAKGDEVLKFGIGPGCKLTYVEEYVREAVYSNDTVVGIRRFMQDSMRFEVTVDISIAFSPGRPY